MRWSSILTAPPTYCAILLVAPEPRTQIRHDLLDFYDSGDRFPFTLRKMAMTKKNEIVQATRDSLQVHSANDASRLRQQTIVAVTGAGAALVCAIAWIVEKGMLGVVGSVTSLAIFAAVAAVVISQILVFHPYRDFGWPNVVTLARTALATLVAGYAAEVSMWSLPPSSHLAWTFTLIAATAVLLDGLDGYLARRFGPRSDFGARFDMESDALLLMILSVLVIVLDKVGYWALLIGGIRYAFVAAARLWSWIDRELPDSMRRKTVCVIQGASLIALISPVVHGQLASMIAAGALATLVWSFAVDLAWLHRHRHSAATGRSA
jgi:phosphatidylglycerophosphate synthase